MLERHCTVFLYIDLSIIKLMKCKVVLNFFVKINIAEYPRQSNTPTLKSNIIYTTNPFKYKTTITDANAIILGTQTRNTQLENIL